MVGDGLRHSLWFVMEGVQLLFLLSFYSSVLVASSSTACLFLLQVVDHTPLNWLWASLLFRVASLF